MKYHKVEGKLPGGVAVRFDERFGKPETRDSMFDFLRSTLDRNNLADFLVDRVAQYSSNVPITLRLDVPEAAAIETARALRAMADELEGEQK